ncbi:MAG: hypothetical protein KDJ16_03130 [Hyphomicrobiales bacterium]|nr:hypothetical protein [Hyphomicrobiales bacterium]
MRRIGQFLFLLFRLFCYAALAAVIAAFALLALLPAIGACTTIGSGGITCGSPWATEAATYAFSIVLLTVFTGIPALFALAGAGFLVHGLYRRHSASRSPSPGAKQAASLSFAAFLLRGVAIVLGIVFLAGVIAGILGG